MKILVRRITTQADLDVAHAIRTRVFVEEQKVPAEAEIDEYELNSRHFLALDEKQNPCDTARWRFTNKGIKLERFAVDKIFRGKGVGSELLRQVLDDISSFPESKDLLIYLHAQLDAIPLYAKFGFKKIGNMFEECNIKHYEMIRPKNSTAI